MPRGEFKYLYCFFADTPNVAWTVSVIWKDLLWRPDFCRYLKQRGGCTIPMFQLSLLCEKYAAARHNSVIGNQLLFANNRNRFRWVVLCLSQDGACTDSFENFHENSLKGDLSNDITLNPPLFSLVNTFKKKVSQISEKFACRAEKCIAGMTLKQMKITNQYTVLAHFDVMLL